MHSGGLLLFTDAKFMRDRTEHAPTVVSSAKGIGTWKAALSLQYSTRNVSARTGGWKNWQSG